MSARSSIFILAAALGMSAVGCRGVAERPPTPSTSSTSAGTQLAERLNARYFDTRTACTNGEAAYHCNGILVRGTEASESHHAWNPSAHSVANGATAFSYLRFDVRSRFLFRAQGIIFRPLGMLTPDEYPLILRCIYPKDAGTANEKSPCTFRKVCVMEGVTTVDAWLEFVNVHLNSCAFTSAPEQFQLSIDVRPSSTQPHAFNEAIVGTWPQNIPQRLPLEALFYRNDMEGGLEGARFIQRDLLNAMGSTVPIVAYNPKAEREELPFSYREEDQAVEVTSGGRQPRR
ncbi:MAG: hypothetical protein ACREPC_01295 [Stenotrophomonas sp.]